jgi:hypothetical protein
MSVAGQKLPRWGARSTSACPLFAAGSRTSRYGGFAPDSDISGPVVGAQAQIDYTAKGLAAARCGEGDVLGQQHRIDGIVAEPLPEFPRVKSGEVSDRT